MLEQAERSVREREPGDGSPQRMMVEQRHWPARSATIRASSAGYTNWLSNTA